jgi:UDP-glucose 4-epimerase
VTGASGFVGAHLVPRLIARGHEVVTLARDGLDGPALPLDAESSRQDWAQGLQGIDGIVHLAAIAHRVPDEVALDRVNVRWPLALFQAAVDAGVTGFVFLSTIKVLGDVSARPLRVEDPYAPGDVYGNSKARAERRLLDEQREHPGLKLAILRPPLVYGPGVKANFSALLGWAERGRRGIPLPFGAARAPRSFISVGNLCEAIIASLGHAGIFHCADPVDLSVAELLEKLGVPSARLVPLPAWLMHGLFAVLGRGAIFDRLYRPLQLDCAASREALGWEPGQTVDEAIAQMLAEPQP